MSLLLNFHAKILSDRKIPSNSRKLLLTRQNYFSYSRFWFWQDTVAFLMFGTKNTTVTSRHLVFQLPPAVSPAAESEVLGECCWWYENCCHYYSHCRQHPQTATWWTCKRGFSKMGRLGPRVIVPEQAPTPVSWQKCFVTHHTLKICSLLLSKWFLGFL